MGKRTIYLLITILFLLASNYSAKATHAAGGEISYEWVSDSTYTVYFKFYRDCSGVAAPGTRVLLCFYNSCNTQSGSKYLYKMAVLPDSTANGQPVSEGCPGVGTRCTNTSSTLPGYEEYWYSGNVTLPSRCSTWTFSIEVNARNPSANLVNIGSRRLYVEATLNNVAARGNSSPYFSVKPVPSVCNNQPYTYNNGGVDPNSDSLTFEIAMPRTSNGGCPPTVSNMSFATMSPALNLTTNPLPCNNTFTIDTTNGQMTFTPNQLGASTVTVRIKEYRNGVLIGSVMRDVQVQVVSCHVPAPIVNTVSSTISGATLVNGRVEACAGVQMSFCFDLKSTDTAAVIVASDNHSAATPGASVTYTGQQTDSVRGCFTWTPGTLDTGLRVFTVTAKDSTCNSPGIIVSQTFVLPIYIWPITDIIKDTTICYGDSTSLLAVGGSAFTWSVISGGSPLSSLSCTTCKEPFAKPTATTQYIVSNSAVQYCSKNKDTVTVTVLDIRDSMLSASNNSPVCEGDTLKLFSSTAPSGFGYKWTGPNSFTSTAQNPTIANISLADTGQYYLSSTKLQCVSKEDSTKPTIKSRPTTPNASNNGPLCPGDTLQLSVDTIANAAYSWVGPNGFSNATQYPSISNVNTGHGGNYIVTAKVNDCNSFPDTTIAIVNPQPAVSSFSTSNPISCGGTQGFITLKGLLASTSYDVEYEKDGIQQPALSSSTDGTGELHMTGLSAGIYSKITVKSLGCLSDTMAPITLVDPNAPTATATNNTPICEGDTLKLFATADSTGVTWIWSGPNSFSDTSQNPVIANAVPTQSGTYTLTATKNNCSSVLDSTTVTVHATPIKPSSSNNGPLCVGNTLQLTTTTYPSGTYSWTGPVSFTDTLNNPTRANIDTTHAGNYIVTVTVNGCISEPDTTVLVVTPTPAPIVDSVTTTDPTTCNGTDGSITLKGLTPNDTFTVNYLKNVTAQPTLTLVANSSGSITISNLSADTYRNLTATTTNGCSSDPITTIVLSDPPLPVISIDTIINPTTCGGTNGYIIIAGLTASETYTVNYQKGGAAQTPLSLTADGSGKVTINNLSADSYTNITATIINCESLPVGPAVVANPVAASAVASSNTPLCQGDTLKLFGSSDSSSVTYAWNGPSSFTSTNQNPTVANITIVNAGQYRLITSKNNCQDTSYTDVAITPTPATPIASSNSPVCTSGNIQLNSSSIVDASYSWTGPSGFSSILQNPLITPISTANAGEYIVTASVNGCISESDTTTVIVNINPTITSSSFTHPTTCNGTEGTITLTGLDTNKTYTVDYQKNNISQPSVNITSNSFGQVVITGLGAGGYRNIVVTINNCSSDPLLTSITLTDPNKPVVNTSNNTPICESDTIKLFATTDSTGVTWIWIGPNSYSSTLQNPTIPNATPTQSGNYILTATINNCTSEPDTTVVLVKPTPANPNATNNTPICSGDTLKLFSDFIANASYNWSGPNGFSDTDRNPARYNASVNATGQYVVQATVDGCVSEFDTTSVVVHLTPTITNSTFTHPTTCNGTEGTITLYGLEPNKAFNIGYEKNSAAQTPINLTSNSSGQITMTGLSKGVYSKITVDANNCFSNTIADITLVDPDAPVVNATNNTPICESDTIKLFATADSTGVTWNWTGPNSFTSTNQNPTISDALPSQSGVHSVTATINNCTSDADTTTVLVKPTPATPTANNNSPLCSGDTLQLTALTITNASYSWTGPNGFADTNQNPTIANVTITTSGDYIVTATVDGCLSEADTTTVIVHQTPSIASTASVNPTTCNGSDGYINLFGLEATTTYLVDYDKDGIPQTTTSIASDATGKLTINNLTKGTYSQIKVTVNNCTSDTNASITLSDPDAPIVNATNNTPICESDTIKLFATADSTGVTWNWTGPNGFSSTNQNPTIGNALPSQSGVYSVTATINNCTSDADTTTVVVKPTPVTPTANNNSPLCSGDTLQLTALTITNASYSWTGPNGFADTNQNPTIANVTITTSGDYIVTATVDGCLSEADTTTVIVHQTPSIASTASVNPTTCNGSDGYINLFGLEATTTYLVDYDKDGIPQTTASIASDATGKLTINNLTKGTYSQIKVTVNNCTSDSTASITISDPDAPVVNASNNTPICESDTIKLFATADSTGVTWNWTGPNGFSSTNQNPTIGNALPSQSGVYSVTATINNCTSDADTTTVVVKPTPVTPTANNNSPLCSGDTLQLTALTIPNASYSWAGPNGFADTNQNPTIANVTITTSGEYIVTATVDGCLSDADTTTVIVHQTPSIASTASVNPTMCNGSDGYINLFGLEATTTYLVDYDKDGIPQSTASIASDATGKLTINNLTKGIYSQIKVTVNNCTSDTTATITLSDPDAPIVNATNNTPICESDTIKLFATADSTGVTWNWTGPNSFSSTNQNPTISDALPSQSGVYSVTATINNCTSDADTTTVVVKPTPPTPNAVNNGPLCSGNTLHLGTDSITNAIFSWTGPNGFTASAQNPSISNAQTSHSGDYIVFATVEGCISATDTTTVIVNALPAPIIGNSTIVHPSTCGGTDGSITLNGLSSNTSYVLDHRKDNIAQSAMNITTDNLGSYTLSNLSQGIYSFMKVTSANGCSSDTLLAITLSDPVPPTISIDTFFHSTTCGGADGKIIISGFAPSTQYNLYYKQNTTPITLTPTSDASGIITLINLSAALYDSIYVEKFNCLSNYLGSIRIDDPERPAVTASNNTPICQADTIKLSATVDSTGVIWSWTGPLGYTSTQQNPIIPNATPSQSGTYTVTATKNNCSSAPIVTTVTVKPTPATPFASSNTPVCSGNTLSLFADTVINATYSWRGPNAYRDSVQNPTRVNATVTMTGEYIVTATVDGCESASDTTSVIVYETPTIDSSYFSHPTTCNGNEGSITLVGLNTNSLYAINYLKNGVTQPSLSLSSNGSGVLSMTGLTEGTYTQINVTINGCSSDTIAPITLIDPISPKAIATNNTTVCEGDTVKLFGNSDSTGVAWSWTGPNSFTSTSQNPVIANALPSQSGRYILTVTKDNCSSDPDTTAVNIQPTPPTPIANSNSPVCDGDSLSVFSNTITGARYSWTGPNSFSAFGQTVGVDPASFNNAGAYIVNVIIGSCISLPDTILVVINPIPTIGGSTFTNPTTCNGSDGTITLTGLKVSTTYTVNFDKAGTPQTPLSLTTNTSGSLTITGLSAGIYSNITVTLLGCTSDPSTTITLVDPFAPVITSIINSTPICEGDSINFTSTASMSGVTWNWTGPLGYTSFMQNPTIYNAVPNRSGTYYLTATKNNCTSQPDSTIVVVKPTPPTPFANNNGPLCAGDKLQLTSSTTSNASYKWVGPLGFSDTTQNPVIPNAQPVITGNYILAITVDGCVSDSDTTYVNVHPIPVAPTVTAFLNYCKDEIAPPLSATGVNLLWYTQATGGSGSSIPPAPSTSSLGTTIWYVSQTVNGCESPRSSITVTVLPNPVVPVATDTISYCKDAVTLPLTAVGTQLKWYTQATGGTAILTPPTPPSNQLGFFKWFVSQTSSNGCESERDSMIVAILPHVNANLTTSSDSICQGDTITLFDNNVGVPNSAYQWTFNDATILSGTGAGPYTLTWSNTGLKQINLSLTQLDCGNPDSTTVYVKQVPDGAFAFSEHHCIGDTAMFIADWEGKASYNWSIDGGELIGNNNQTINVVWNSIGSKVISLIVTTDENCSSEQASETITIHDRPIAEIKLLTLDKICAGDSVTVEATAQNDNSYSWYSANPVFNISDNRASIQVLESNPVNLTVTDVWSCTSNDSFMIDAEHCCDIAMPSAFSPNGDGLNDVFKIITIGNHTVQQFIIVNRWGQKVFQTKDQHAGWNGRFNNKHCDIGTYEYYVKYRCSNGKIIEKKGDVTLVR